MHIVPNMRQRSSMPEIMDDPASDAEQLFTTLKQFELTNRLLSRSRHLIKKILIPHMCMQRDSRIIFLDIGCGGCDIDIWLAAYCEKLRIDISILCMDSDPRVIAYAKRACREYPSITVLHGDALEIDKSGFQFDYIFSNHFLHHLPAEIIPAFLENVNRCAKKGFLMNDLVRSPTAYLLFSLFGSLFLRDSFSREDGRRSVRKGFTVREVKSIIRKCDLHKSVTVETIFPWRIYCHKKTDN